MHTVKVVPVRERDYEIGYETKNTLASIEYYLVALSLKDVKIKWDYNEGYYEDYLEDRFYYGKDNFRQIEEILSNHKEIPLSNVFALSQTHKENVLLRYVERIPGVKVTKYPERWDEFWNGKQYNKLHINIHPMFDANKIIQEIESLDIVELKKKKEKELKDGGLVETKEQVEEKIERMKSRVVSKRVEPEKKIGFWKQLFSRGE